jgi:hypothetical protein
MKEKKTTGTELSYRNLLKLSVITWHKMTVNTLVSKSGSCDMLKVFRHADK